jgi:glycosyltransferase involved in cell wall biosynthesis
MKLSIITINLNNSAGLLKTIKSVITQNYQNFEYIIIDGGSTDDSLKIINELSANQILLLKNIKFSFKSEHDNGIYNAMNKGIKMAKNEYCYFLNSGDYFADTNVINRITEIKCNEDIIYGNLIVTKGNKLEGKIYGKINLSMMDLYLSNVIKHQSAFIKKSLLIDHNLYNENLRIVADWEFFLKVIGFNKSSYKYVNIDIAYFDNDGISNRSEELCKKERDLVLSNYFNKMILDDYKKFKKYLFMDKVLSSKTGYLILKFIGKLYK